jgi:predicted ribosomally synthesized peptide with nif11-like leader
MTSEAVNAFIERVGSDPAFRDQLAAAPTLEERLQIANAADFAIDAADLQAIRLTLQVEELSDEDLDAVAGGYNVVSSMIQGATTDQVIAYTRAFRP